LVQKKNIAKEVCPLTMKFNEDKEGAMKKSDKPEDENQTQPPADAVSNQAEENQNGSMPAPESEPESAPETSQEPLVGLTITEYNEMQDKITQSEQKGKEFFEGWQRERADFLNYRKRIERENAQLHQNLTGQILKKYLVIVDDLDRALKARPSQGEGAEWADGIELVYRKLSMILDGEGVKIIPADGAMFDPSLHEAISNEDSPDHESGQVIEVLQKGYTINERVLRPALVRVAR
jgi:molecular chaperone GrpE